MDKKEYNCPDCKVPGITCKCCQRYFEMNKQVDCVWKCDKEKWYQDWTYRPELQPTYRDHDTCKHGGTTILNETFSSDKTT